jgi:glutathione S-transferase
MCINGLVTLTPPLYQAAAFPADALLPGASRSWSPNTLRTRLVLNFKGIRYSQSWIPYPDIAPLLKSLNVPPLKKGGIPYTLPAIIHTPSISNPSGAMNDSFPIALHLEELFPAPEYPSLFPSEGSFALALAVQKLISGAIAKGFTIVVPKVADILEPRCSEFFHRTRTATFGKPLSEVAPKPEQLEKTWKPLRAELEVLASMLKGKKGKSGPFLEGEKAGYGDFLIVSFLAWFERADPKDWEKLIAIGDGEFKRLYEACRPWLDGQGEERPWNVAKL